MSAAVRIEPRVLIGRVFLPLRFAMLCINCETLYDMRDKACPACGSRTNVLLATWLRQRTGEKAEW
jgi:rRNA maturation endonuclease Nob1